MCANSSKHIISRFCKNILGYAQVIEKKILEEKDNFGQFEKGTRKDCLEQLNTSSFRCELYQSNKLLCGLNNIQGEK